MNVSNATVFGDLSLLDLSELQYRVASGKLPASVAAAGLLEDEEARRDLADQIATAGETATASWRRWAPCSNRGASPTRSRG